jgi:hypothetical protein
MSVVWLVAPLSLEDVYRRITGVCCLYHQGDEGDYFPEYGDSDYH